MTNHEDTHSDVVDAESATADTSAVLEDIVDEFIGLGRMWAKHGIKIGKMALKSSATTLEVTSGVLNKLADRLTPAGEQKT